MIPSIHLHMHREAVRTRVWTDTDGLIMVVLGQGLGEVALRLRKDSAAALAMSLVKVLRNHEAPPANGDGVPALRQRDTVGRRDPAAHRKEVLR